MATIELKHPSGSHAVIAVRGANCLSFTTASNRSILFQGQQLDLNNLKGSVHAGVPVCWPQFASQGPLPMHGFVRDMDWKVDEKKETAEETFLELSVSATEQTASIVPWDFRCILRIGLTADDIQFQLSFQHSHTEAVNMTYALHTYFLVEDIEKTTVQGLQQVSYYDKTRDETLSGDDVITVTEETDRIYRNAPDHVVIRDGEREIHVDKSQGFPDWVVWNIYKEKVSGIWDMKPEDYQKYICVEAASTTATAFQPDTLYVAEMKLSPK